MWSERYTQDFKPEISDITEYIDSPIWIELCQFIETTYQTMPSIEYSKCSMAKGWNVKYKKGSRAICTLYPNKEYFTCLITIGSKESMETELLMSSCTEYMQELYNNVNPKNGTRWLMINVTSNEILQDVKSLIRIRIPVKK